MKNSNNTFVSTISIPLRGKLTKTMFFVDPLGKIGIKRILCSSVFCKFLLSFLWLLISNSISATNIVAVQSGDWNDPSTWNPATVPASNDDVTISGGFSVTVSDNQMSNGILLDSNSVLAIATGGTLTTTGNLVFNDTLYIDGVYNMNGGTHQMIENSVFLGTGTLNFSEANIVNISAPVWYVAVSISNLNHSAILTINGQFSFGEFNWHDNTHFNFSAVCYIDILNIVGQGTHEIVGSVFNCRELYWQNGNVSGLGNCIIGYEFNSVSIDEAATFDMNLEIGGLAQFVGGGTFNKPINGPGGEARITVQISDVLTTSSDINIVGGIDIEGTYNANGGNINAYDLFLSQGSTLNVANNVNFNLEGESFLLGTTNFNGNWNGTIINGGNFDWNAGELTSLDTNVYFKNDGIVNLLTSAIHKTSCKINNIFGIFNWDEGGFSAGNPNVDFSNLYGGTFNINCISGTSSMPIKNEAIINSNVNVTFSNLLVNEYSGIINLTAGTLKLIDNLTNFGTIKGNGSIETTIIEGPGELAPGASPGTIIIVGDYTAGILAIEFDETMGIVTKDSVHVSGNVNLNDGTLDISIINGTIPAGSYTILKCVNLSGTFASITGGDCFTLEYGTDKLILKVGVIKTWDGSNDVWGNPAKWIPSGVPCPFDSIIINSGIVTLDIQPEMKSLTINGGQINNTSGSFSINAPTVIANGAKCVVNQPLAFTGILDNSGTIQGVSTIDLSTATVINGYGKWAPGNSAGDLSATGVYDNEIIEMEIGGNGGGGGIVEVDLLSVSQTMVVGGDLIIPWLGGTIPPGNRILMQCDGGSGCRTGTFGSVTFPPQCGGGCSIEYTPTEVRLINTIPIEFIGTCTWIGGTGNWSNAAKWSCNDVPNANDDVVINSGSVNIIDPTTVKTLNLTGGALSGSGSITVNNSVIWSGGQIDLTGSTSLATATISGTVGISNGNLILAQGGTMNSATVELSNNGVITLPATKTLELINTGTINNTSTGEFVNNGTLLKSGTGQFNFNSNLTNNGTLTANAGVLKISKNLSSTGLIKGVGILNLMDADTVSKNNVNPGNSPGLLTIEGNYTNKNLIIEFLESSGVTTHDQLIVTQNITLEGVDNELVIDNNGGGAVPYGVYEFLHCNGTVPCRTGTFDGISYPAFCAGGCSLIYTDDGVKLNFQAGLPVELLSFDGYPQDGSIELSWRTASEVGTDLFVIQSLNQSEWEPIGTIFSKGNSLEKQDYNFIDKKPKVGFNLYRLEVVDFDGHKEYSPVISVAYNVKKDWKLFPNPVEDLLYLDPGQIGSGYFQIFNGSGFLLAQLPIEEFQVQQLDVSNYPSGIYGVCIPGFSCKMFIKP